MPIHRSHMTASRRRRTCALGGLGTRGFTLVELMLALLMFSILAAVSYSYYGAALEQNKNDAALTDLARIKLAIDNYESINGEPPDSLADIGMDALADPWGNPYVFVNFDVVHGNGHKRKDHNLVPINTRYDLYSTGADGRSASPLTAAISRDDLIVANDGSYIGLASEY
jgi:general secretion pathway protein G